MKDLDFISDEEWQDISAVNAPRSVHPVRSRYSLGGSANNIGRAPNRPGDRHHRRWDQAAASRPDFALLNSCSGSNSARPNPTANKSAIQPNNGTRASA
jgi:hypothetical protein